MWACVHIYLSCGHVCGNAHTSHAGMSVGMHLHIDRRFTIAQNLIGVRLLYASRINVLRERDPSRRKIWDEVQCRYKMQCKCTVSFHVMSIKGF